MRIMSTKFKKDCWFFHRWKYKRSGDLFMRNCKKCGCGQIFTNPIGYTDPKPRWMD